MQVVLQVEQGPAAGKSVVVCIRQPFYVGRSETMHLAIAGDGTLSDAHFVLECSEHECRLRDLGSRHGTLVNGTRVREVQLRDGDKITAGASSFAVRFAKAGDALASAPTPTPAEPPPVASLAPTPDAVVAPPPPQTPIQQNVLDVLRAEKEPLFALLDAARDVRIYVLLQQCKEERQSLYEGPKGEELALVAPYLVRLPPHSPFLETLVREGWGNSWGVYLLSRAAFKEVRQNFRRFLLVDTEDGKKLYFRFYDPRVLRIYLPTCTRTQLSEFYGPVSAFLAEAEDPSALLKFVPTAAKLDRRQITLAHGPPAVQTRC